MIYGLNNIYLKKHKHLGKKRKTTPQNKQNQTNNNKKNLETTTRKHTHTYYQTTLLKYASCQDNTIYWFSAMQLTNRVNS